MQSFILRKLLLLKNAFWVEILGIVDEHVCFFRGRDFGCHRAVVGLPTGRRRFSSSIPSADLRDAVFDLGVHDAELGIGQWLRRMSWLRICDPTADPFLSIVEFPEDLVDFLERAVLSP